MKVDLRTTPHKVETAVRKIVNATEPKVKEKLIPKHPLNDIWSVVEKHAEEMSPQEYLNARQYLASLENLYMFEK